MKQLLIIINNYREVSHNRHLLRLIQYLVEQKVSITLLTISPVGELDLEFNHLPVQHISVSQLRNFFRTHPHIKVITKELRSEYLVFLYRYIFGVHHVTHYAIRPSYGFLPESLWKLSKHLLFLVSLHLVDINIAVGDTVAQRIHPKVICIPNSIPSQTKHQPHSGVIKFVYSGNLEPRKNILYTLSILKELKMPFEFIILGDGHQQFILQQYITSYHLQKQVKLAGFVTNVQDYLEQADLFIFLTKMEGLSLSLLEAMGAGLVCAVSDIPENREIISDGLNGILLPLNQPQQAAAKLNQLLSQDNWRKLGQQAQLTIVNKYTDAISFKKYLDLLTA